MRELKFRVIVRAIKDFKLPHFDLVVGIAQGGIVPASLIAGKLGCDLKILQINYRDQRHKPKYPKPLLLRKCSLPKNTARILIVDDVSITGATLELAKNLLKNYKVKTLVLRGRADYVLFAGLNSCVKWPWSTLA